MSIKSHLVQLLPEFGTQDVYYAANTSTSDAQLCSNINEINIRNIDLIGKGSLKYFKIYTLYFVYSSEILLDNGNVLHNMATGFHVGNI